MMTSKMESLFLRCLKSRWECKMCVCIKIENGDVLEGETEEVRRGSFSEQGLEGQLHGMCAICTEPSGMGSRKRTGKHLLPK